MPALMEFLKTGGCRGPSRQSSWLALFCKGERSRYIYIYIYMGVSQNWGYLLGGPNNKDYSILGSILGYPSFGKLPYIYTHDRAFLS